MFEKFKSTKVILSIILCMTIIMSLVSFTVQAANQPVITVKLNSQKIGDPSQDISIQNGDILEVIADFSAMKANDTYQIKLPDIFLSLNENTIKNQAIIDYVDFRIEKSNGEQTVIITFKQDVAAGAFSVWATADFTEEEVEEEKEIVINKDVTITIIPTEPQTDPGVGVGYMASPIYGPEGEFAKYASDDEITEKQLVEDTDITSAFHFFLYINASREEKTFNSTVVDELPEGMNLFIPSAPGLAGNFPSYEDAINSLRIETYRNTVEGNVTDGFYSDYTGSNVLDDIITYINRIEKYNGRTSTYKVSDLNPKITVPTYYYTDSYLNDQGQITTYYSTVSVGYKINNGKIQATFIDRQHPGVYEATHTGVWTADSKYVPLYDTDDGSVGSVYWEVFMDGNSLQNFYLYEKNDNNGTLVSYFQYGNGYLPIYRTYEGSAVDGTKTKYSWDYKVNGTKQFTVHIINDSATGRDTLEIEMFIDEKSPFYGKALIFAPAIYFDQSKWGIPSNGRITFNNTATYKDIERSASVEYNYYMGGNSTVVAGAGKTVENKSKTYLDPTKDTTQTYALTFTKLGTANVAEGFFNVLDQLDKNLEFVSNSIKIYKSSGSNSWTEVATTQNATSATTSGTNNINLKAYYDSALHQIKVTNDGVGEMGFTNQIKIEFKAKVKSDAKYGVNIINYFGKTVETFVDHKLSINKVDDQGNLIKTDSAEFSIKYTTQSDYKNGTLANLTDNNAQTITSLSTGSTGIASTLYRLDEEVFYLKITETSVPDGYTGISAPIWVKAVRSGTTNEMAYTLEEAPDGVGIIVNPDGSMTLTVPNEGNIEETASVEIQKEYNIGKTNLTETEKAQTYVFDFNVYKLVGGVKTGDPIRASVTVAWNETSQLFKGTAEVTGLEPGAEYFVEEDITGLDGDITHIWSAGTGYTVTTGGVTFTAVAGDGSEISVVCVNTKKVIIPTSINLKATKIGVGRALTNGQFSFAVKEGETVVATGTNDADGNINFSHIQYTSVGTHTYTIVETSSSGNGWTVDNTVKTVTVTVVDSGNGVLVATADKNASEIVFTNTYTVTPTTITLEATKAAIGKLLTDGQFSFTVKEGETVVATGTNDASGNIEFSAIQYTQAGTHTYTITETSVSGNGWTVDGTVKTVTVTVVDNGDGTLTATADKTAEEIIFTNTYSTSDTSIYIQATKVGNGRKLTDGQFSFALKEGEAVVATGTNNASGLITFGEINYTKAGVHNYTIVETSVSGNGWTVDSTVHTVTVTVVDNGDGTLTATANKIASEIVFTNAYTVAPTSISLEAKKVAIGRTLTNGQFSFEVREGGIGGTAVATGTNDADGNIKFSAIQYTQAGTHTYTITETSVSGNGWTVDSAVHTVTVTVVDNGNGTLTATSDKIASEIVFTNTYTVVPTSINLEAKKVATGRALTDGQFSFEIREGATIVATGTNDADGNIKFSYIQYTQAGTHTYTIVETSTSGNGWTVDNTVHTVTVTVVDNGDGTLIATADKTALEIVFTNTYTASSASINLGATKVAAGRPLTNGQFSFAVKEGEIVVATGTNDASGLITFEEINYTKAGVHNYTIVETSVSGSGWTVDSAVYTITVTVVDNGDGTLTATANKTAAEIVFTNTYTAAPTSINLKATKIGVGRALTNGQFSFAVKEGETVVATGTNDADGNINFSHIQYTSVGTHTYTIVETSASANGWTVDSTVKTVTVTVVDSGNGVLVATADKNASEIVFTNTYTVTPTTITLEATKAAIGKLLTDGQFSFTVKEGETVVATGTNDASGNIEFSAIQYTQAGTHTYTITETSVSGNGWTVDGTVKTVTVTVVDNGDGTLTATADKTAEEIIFTNTYSTADTSIYIQATKVGNGRKLTDGQFSFALKEGETVVATGTNDASGLITFEEINYTKAGVHNYTIVETSVSGNGWTVDSTVHTVTVTVVDNGNGTLTATANKIASEIVFTNAYTVVPTSISLEAKKASIGRTLTNGQFSFEVREGGIGGTAVATGTNDADGNIKFSAIQYTQAGTHIYTIVETSVSANGWTVDSAVHTVTVTVVDNGNGTLTATSDKIASEIVFTNTYTVAPTSINLEAKKVATGRALTDGQFSFEIREGATVVATGTNDADGNIKFSYIQYTQAGTHTYTIVETSTSGNGWTVDSTVHTVTVTVVDNGDGTLIATADKTASEMVFTNTYTVAPTSISLEARKIGSGRALTDGQFSFAVIQGIDGPVAATGTNDADGNIKFSAIQYTQAGEYVYTIVETSVSGNGWTVDSTIYKVTVTVVDNGDGTLTATADRTASEIVFTNAYATDSVSVTLNALKTVEGTGASLIDGQFNFAVLEGRTTVATGTNNSYGEIKFSAINYNKAGTYTYTVVETSKGNAVWTVDSTIYTVTVTVVDNGDGTLTASVAYPEGGIVFLNTYNPPEEPGDGIVSLRISKSLTNDDGNTEGTGRMFAVRIYDSYMNFIKRVIVTANEGDVVITGLNSNTTYYIAEETGEGFEILGYEVVGVGTANSKVLGIKIPEVYSDALEIRIVVNNQVTDIREIPPEEPPLGPFDPEEPGIIEIPPEEPPFGPPDTGDVSDISVILVCAASVLILPALYVKKRRTKKSV